MLVVLERQSTILYRAISTVYCTPVNVLTAHSTLKPLSAVFRLGRGGVAACQCLAADKEL